MLSRAHRLRSNARIRRVKQDGRAYQNHWFVLVKLANCCPVSRFAFSVSRRLGNAVTRNRIKRCMREAVRRSLPRVRSGYDVLLIARSPVARARSAQIDGGVADVLKRSRLLAHPTVAALNESRIVDPGLADDGKAPPT